jgi:FtsZ-binding cell division protein ZapB
MLSLEHIKLLETKISQTVEYIERLTGENSSLRKKLDVNQKRIDELEGLVSRFKEEQGRFEDGILSALDRLSQFENAIEKSLASRPKESKPAVQNKPVKASGQEPVKPAPQPDTPAVPALGEEPPAKPPINKAPGNRVETVIPDIADPLECDGDSGDQPDSESPDSNGELDIF